MKFCTLFDVVKLIFKINKNYDPRDNEIYLKRAAITRDMLPAVLINLISLCRRKEATKKGSRTFAVALFFIVVVVDVVAKKRVEKEKQ